MHALGLSLGSRKLALGSAAAIAVTGAVAFAGPAIIPTASAGANGQQIALCSSQAYRADLKGTNANGEVVELSAQSLLDLPVDGNGCFQVSGSTLQAPDPTQFSQWKSAAGIHWWKGDVTIHWTYPGNTWAESVCSVPTSADSDFFSCSDTNAVPWVPQS